MREEPPEPEPTILLVEGHTILGEVLRRTLEMFGFMVLQADSSTAALNIFNCHRGSIHLLLMDVSTPGDCEPKLAKVITRMRPATRVICIVNQAHSWVLPDEHWLLVEKPFRPADLGQALRDLLDLDRDRGPACEIHRRLLPTRRRNR
jgi:two-component system cell cycle sensor histidine kinase/response regulator CckA